MRKPKILIALSTFAEHEKKPLVLLKKSGLPFVLNTSGQRLTQQGIIKLGADCQGIVAGVEPYSSQVLSELPRLKWISRCGVGMDNIDLIKAKELGIRVFNTPEPVSVPVAELTVGIMLDLLRHISWHTISLRNHKWQKKCGQNLSGKTVGIVGLGRIGKKVADLLKGFDVRRVASDPYPDQRWAQKNNVELLSTQALLKVSDIVTLHLRVDRDLPFILGHKQISLMKRSAILLNLARGEMVDEQALYQALKEGRLAAAGLDVFVQEPYFGKLSSLENVVMTPHVATLTKEARLQMETQAVENLLNVLRRKTGLCSLKS